MANRKPADDTHLLWERQKGENQQPWEAFQIYFKQEKKNLTEVAAQLQKSYALIRRWSKTWFWEERWRAYQNSLLREEYEEVKKERRIAAKNKRAIARRFTNIGMEAIKQIDGSTLTAKDLPMIIKLFETAFELEEEGTEKLLADYEAELGEGPDADGEEDVVVYVPDNGMRRETE